ncbi:MAG: (2Fe-2S)-binding protein [Chloroflexota bacterium]
MKQHPLTETFTQVKRVVEHVNAQLEPDDLLSWMAPSDLFGDSSQTLADLRKFFEKSLKTTSKNVLGSALIQAYQWQIIMTAVGCFLVSKRVPDISLNNVRVKLFEDNEDGEVGVGQVAFITGRFFALPNDPAASHPDAEIVTDVAALRFRMRLGIVEHFNWVISRIGHYIGTKPRGLWLDVADNCVSTIIWFMQEIDANVASTAVEHEIKSLIRIQGSPLNFRKLGIFTLTYKDKTQAHHNRASCCYWYRYDDPEAGYCSSCPRRPMEERRELFLGYMVEEYDNVGAVGTGDNDAKFTQ